MPKDDDDGHGSKDLSAAQQLLRAAQQNDIDEVKSPLTRVLS